MANIGDLERLQIQLTDALGKPADPTTLTLTVQAPDGTQTLYTTAIIRDTLGAYHLDLSLLQSGIYTFRWTATGTVQLVSEGFVSVSTTLLSTAAEVGVNDLCTLDQVKSWLSIKSNEGDLGLQRLITASSQYLLAKMQRITFNPVLNYSERRNGTGTSRLALKYWPVTQVNSLTINNFTIPASADGIQAGWVTDGKSILLIGQSFGGIAALGNVFGTFLKGYQNVVVNYNYNTPGIPYDVQQACIELVAFKQVRERQHVGRTSEVFPGIGTTAYINKDVPPGVQATVEQWKIRFDVTI